jgi:hypothetical protein
MHNPDAPNFMLLGAAKAATTSLHHYLLQHPEIYLPKEKEIQFFTDDALYEKGLDYYLRHYFREARGFPARGEATPFYFHRSEVVIPRLIKCFGLSGLKFVIVLRDPVKRAWSHYQHMLRLGLETLEFEQALEQEAERMKDQPLSWYSYYSDGLYASQLHQWFEHFPKESFFVISQDDLIEDSHRVLATIFCFLGVDPDILIRDISIKNEAAEPRSALFMRVLSGRTRGGVWIKKCLPIPLRRRIGMTLRQLNTRPVSQVSEMKPETRIKLGKAYENDLVRLENLLGRSFASWRQNGS